jgi:hypothetical protein
MQLVHVSEDRCIVAYAVFIVFSVHVEKIKEIKTLTT